VDFDLIVGDASRYQNSSQGEGGTVAAAGRVDVAGRIQMSVDLALIGGTAGNRRAKSDSRSSRTSWFGHTEIMKKLLDVAHKTKQRFDQLLDRANVNDSGESRVSALYLLTISEQFAAALQLADNGFATHAPTLVRSMLDGFASLSNLVKDPNYLDQIRFEDARSKIAVFDEFSKDPNVQSNPETLAKRLIPLSQVSQYVV
jgi:hypothetical protein